MSVEVCVIISLFIVCLTVIITGVLDKFNDIFRYYETKDELRDAELKINTLTIQLNAAKEEIDKLKYLNCNGQK